MEKTKVVPVIKLENAEDAVPLAEALLKGGIDIAEITYRTECAPEAIRRIRRELPQILTGAGTVINPEMALSAMEAGAEFIVSPGFNPLTADFALKNNAVYIPGTATASEIEAALMKNLKVLKLFPAEVLGGTKLLKAFKGPFPQVKFLPTGGINADNYLSYLGEGNVLAVGGTWMIKNEMIKAKNWKAITEECKKISDTLKG